MGLETIEMWYNGIKIVIFLNKIQKNQTTVGDPFELHKLAHHVSQLRHMHYNNNNHNNNILIF